MTDLIVQYLIDHSQEALSYKYVCGEYRGECFDDYYSHAWLEINGELIVDLTADQFKNNPLFCKSNPSPCYVGNLNHFYSLFDVEPSQCFTHYGLKALGQVAYKRLSEIYNKILSYIDR